MIVDAVDVFSNHQQRATFLYDSDFRFVNELLEIRIKLRLTVDDRGSLDFLSLPLNVVAFYVFRCPSNSALDIPLV
uniref:Neur_chan_LBD domain-containing protein n=1 Tax=Angiostrongylus cantonensis TaxID=6313 RepID=A0A0K0CX72_ANGCA